MKKSEDISALIDDELDDVALSDILGQLSESDKQKVDDYFLIGDLLRSVELTPYHSVGLLSRIESSIAQEPTVISPSLKNKIQKDRLDSQKAGAGWFAGVAAVALFAFGINQAIPPLDSEVQMLTVQQAAPISDKEMALWQEYFLAHQQNVMRSGLSGVSPIARAEADQPKLRVTNRVNVSESRAGEWINIWDLPSGDDSARVEYQYISSVR
jgi:hypothetical protein